MTTASIGTQTDKTPYSLSPLTCHEIIDKLTDTQIERETKFLVDNDGHLLSSEMKKSMLIKNFDTQIRLQNDNLTEKVFELTKTFSRNIEKAERDMELLQETISTAQQMLNSMTQQPPPPPTITDGTTHIQGTVPRPYYKIDDSPLDQFNIDLLDADTVYDKTFENRKVAYYGDVPYRYQGGSHVARSMSDNPYLSALSVRVEDLCNDIGIDFPRFNSVMVTKYDNHNSCIPPHSDDESSIVPDSDILTVSLGSTRQVAFRRKLPGVYSEEILEVAQGDVYIMSRFSQDYYDHAVPKIRSEEYKGPRISITYRALKIPTSPPSPTPLLPASQAEEHDVRQPKVRRAFTPPKLKVLILSDSKNRNFDCSQFQDPVVVFRKDLFYLRDLYLHKEAIAQADLVLLSAGVNDLRNNKVSARTLHDHVRDFVSQFGGTQFLFDAICPLSMNADRFNKLNDSINNTNEFMLKFSIRSDNFKLFDNLSFGLSHLARDGIHLNYAGKLALSNCWMKVILIRLGLVRGFLPIRHNFRSILHDYNLAIG